MCRFFQGDVLPLTLTCPLVVCVCVYMLMNGVIESLTIDSCTSVFLPVAVLATNRLMRTLTLQCIPYKSVQSERNSTEDILWFIKCGDDSFPDHCFMSQFG